LNRILGYPLSLRGFLFQNMKNFITLNSKLYATLFQRGGDNLLAIYAKLKYCKNGEIKIYKEEGRNIFTTLKRKTDISVSTLRKYIKVLIEEDTCYFDTKGNLVLRGGNTINKQFSSRKTVKIEVGTYQETKVNSFKVRVLFMEKLQRRAIDRKAKRNNIKARSSKGYFITKKERSFLKRCEDRDKRSDYNLAKTVLSNYGFSKLKHGAIKSKSSGHYHKNKLLKAKIIIVERRYQFIMFGSKSEYLRDKQFDRTLRFSRGRIYRELVAHFTTEIPKPDEVGIKVEETVVEVYKKLEYLSFDMIDFWRNN
jgi:hypothetical protein